jgi:imidazolonepropionase-like amidohydrolase
MNIDKRTGSIKTGKQADLIIIDGDPLTTHPQYPQRMDGDQRRAAV